MLKIKTKSIAYKTLCRPLLEYSLAVWDPYLKKIDSLEMVQNRAVHFIAGLKGMCSMSEETEKIGLEPLVKRRKDFKMNTMIKILQNEELQPSLVEYFTQYQGQSRITRAFANKHPNSQRINGYQFLHSFMQKKP